ncbi:CD5 antigen-like [Brachyhypopomus gauderio]|uniref:CD5 antigen-like n=1 Tax=Brachyhypopomus gauderio TaxID=698409 RepID=UPI0040430312
MLTVLILVLSCSSAEMKLVRLVGGDGHCSGKPEVFYDGKWHRVYSSNFDFRNAMVVCRDLGCGNAVNISDALELKDKGTRVDVRCEGQEASLEKCKHHGVSAHRGGGGCGRSGLYSHNAELVCSEPVRLVDGGGFCSGRLEVKSEESWTTVCEADFDWQDAEVVCRELGCGSPLTLQGALSGEERYQFGTNKFQCMGSEKRLSNCSTSASEDQNCTLSSAVNLTCSGPDDVRVSEHCAGAVEMYFSGDWKKVASELWSLKEAAVVCRQLNCGSSVAALHLQEGVGLHGWGFGIQCTGTEEAVRECTVKTAPVVKILAGVVCSDLLVQPSVSFSAPIRPSRGLQGPAVFRGHSFTITCSTQPQYPGGSFHLTLPWNNISHAHPAVNHSASPSPAPLNHSAQEGHSTSHSLGPSEATPTRLSITQPAVSHSASFLFPVADDPHQGTYSCFYDNQVSIKCVRFNVGDEWKSGPLIHNFSSSMSGTISIGLADSPVPAVITRMMVVPSLLLITCFFIFLICKKRRRFLMRHTSGHQGAADPVYETIELVGLQRSKRGAGKEQRTDVKEEEEGKPHKN